MSRKSPPPAAPTDGDSPDPEAIRDTLLRTIEIRVNALHALAKVMDEPPPPPRAEDDEGDGETEPVKPQQFPAYELQVYATAVSSIIESELRHLRELGKLKPDELDAACAARIRLARAKLGEAA